MRNATPPVLSSAAALLDGIFEHPARLFSRCATRGAIEVLVCQKSFPPTSISENLQDKALEIARLRHGGEDGMVAGLSTLF